MKKKPTKIKSKRTGYVQYKDDSEEFEKWWVDFIHNHSVSGGSRHERDRMFARIGWSSGRSTPRKS